MNAKEELATRRDAFNDILNDIQPDDTVDLVVAAIQGRLISLNESISKIEMRED